MSPKKSSLRQPYLSRTDQTQLWSDTVIAFVTSNPFQLDLQLKVVSFIRDQHHADLLELADAWSRTVYGDKQTHYLFHQLAALIRKFPLLAIDVDPKRVARESLRKQEHRNKWINRKILASRRAVSSLDPIFHYARNYLVSTLSKGNAKDESGFRVPFPDLKKILERCTFTGGAALGVHGNATNILRKLSVESWTVTPSCYRYAKAAVALNAQLVELVLLNEDGLSCSLLSDFDKRFADKCVFVDANKGDSVDKTAGTDRSITVEPLLNLFVQVGAGLTLRSNLRRVGIDLTNQKVNQMLALDASKDDDPNGYCTIDISNSSESQTWRLYEELFPPEWFEFLDNIRSPFTRYDGEAEYAATERFVGMGNGFCFPAQTLIYASLIYAANCLINSEHPYDFSVYGDDLIVRKEVYEEVVSVLKQLGMRVNTRKSFSSGPFRESCGVDAYEGEDIRPIYCNGFETVTKVYNLYNQSIRRPYSTDAFAEVRRTLKRYIKRHKPHYYLVCPYDPALGHESTGSLLSDPNERLDGAFWVPFDEAISHRDALYHLETWSWSFKLLCPIPKVDYVQISSNSPSRIIADLWTALTGGSSERPYVLRYSNTFRKVRYWGPSGWLPNGL